MPRYLEAIKRRLDKLEYHPGRDRAKISEFIPLQRRLDAVSGKLGNSNPDVERYRWMLEEFRVSLFAQELGTAEPVSAVKLDRALAALKAGAIGRKESAAPAAAGKPIVAASLPEKKSAPLKNLSALDKLFGR